MKPYYEHAGITIYHGDSREILPLLPDVDLVVTDPPYTFGIASTGDEGKCGSWGDLMNSSVWYESWILECKRLTANRQGALWVFNSWRSFPVLAKAAHYVWGIESLLVWDKCWIGPGGARGLRPSYELVALLCHPGFQLPNRGLPDIWKSPFSSTKPHGHSAEKPIDLLTKLLKESARPLILDPFLGSGTTLAAAKVLGMSAIGIEIEERWCEIAATRLSQEMLELPSASAVAVDQPRQESQETITFES